MSAPTRRQLVRAYAALCGIAQRAVRWHANPDYGYGDSTWQVSLDNGLVGFSVDGTGATERDARSCLSAGIALEAQLRRRGAESALAALRGGR